MLSALCVVLSVGYIQTQIENGRFVLKPELNLVIQQVGKVSRGSAQLRVLIENTGMIESVIPSNWFSDTFLSLEAVSEKGKKITFDKLISCPPVGSKAVQIEASKTILSAWQIAGVLYSVTSRELKGGAKIKAKFTVRKNPQNIDFWNGNLASSQITPKVACHSGNGFFVIDKSVRKADCQVIQVIIS